LSWPLSIEADSKAHIKFGTDADMKQMARETNITLEFLQKISGSMGVKLLGAKSATIFNELAEFYSAKLH
jgi:hypothetical protein